MKYYYGFFRDTNTSSDPEGQLYKVVIKTKKGEGEQELLFSSSPFTVTYNSDELFKAYKCSSAKIGLLNLDYNNDFVCESIKDNEVYLYKLNDGLRYSDELKNESSDSQFFSLEWCGYTTPDVYSQGYNSYLDEFELECQDKLSILKYYNWEDIRITKNSRYNLYNIIWTISNFLNLDEILITKSLRIPNIDSYNKKDKEYSFILKTYVLESTLYDNDEEPKKVIDILDNIMSFLSLTSIQINNKLYIVNYNAIVTDFPDYLSIDLKTHKINTKCIDKEYNIVSENSAANDTSLSVMESYDDFVINTEANEVSRNYPSIEWYNKTPSSIIDELYSQCNGRINTHYGVSVLQKLAYWDNYNIYQQRTNIPDSGVSGYTSIQFYNFNKKDNYYSPDFKFYGYNSDVRWYSGGFTRGTEIDDYVAGQCCLTGNTNSIRNRVSSMPVSYALIQNDDWSKQLDNEHEDGIFICHPVLNAEMMTNEEWLSLISDSTVITSQPMVDITYKNVSITKEHPLCWSGEVQFFPDYIPCCYESSTNVERALDRWNLSISLKTATGTYYYDDIDNRWYSFVVLLHPSLGINYGDAMFGNKHKFINNRTNRYNVSSYTDGIVISGYGKDYVGDLTIRLYRPFGPDSTFTKITSSTLLTNINLVSLNTRNTTQEFVSDFTKYEYKDKNKFINSVNEENLIYTSSNYIPSIDNNLYIEDETGNYKIIDYMLDIPAGDVFRCEEHRLRDKTKQFLTPSLNLKSSLHCDVDMITKVKYHRFNDKVFVVNGLDIDYGNDTRTINIIEKK